ncbi:kinase-like protein [Rhizophagus irregularis]|uniref:Kinase-like protein n=1 Tax=Rhizophagus irregularis TaxID=588596 RepID=A0A2I1GNQ1_9GLOM|nr:kinase-like protein [Rhizophagus irregularis]
MTSFNEWIDGDIDFINYNEFSNMKKVGEGSFGIVESTDWKSYKIQAALKTLISNTIDDYDLNNFVKELKNLKKASFHPNIIGFYGITKEPLSNKYIMVLEYANQGNLREYLKNNFKFLQWSDKIQMALDIARGLICLHFKNIIHRDLHAKNILVNNNRLMITDFGTSKQLLEHTSNSTHSTADGLGMAEYNEPQLFKIINYKKDKKSDIYSLGVLLWEISSGRLPFPDYPRNVLGSHISHLNLRENPIEGTPLKYQQLYQECWDNEPKSRPDIEKVYETLSQLITEDFSSLSSSQPNVNEINEIKNSTIDYNDDLSISGYLNSRRVSSHKPDKPDGFTEEALNNWCKLCVAYISVIYT